jgi:hypothetical protein
MALSVPLVRFVALPLSVPLVRFVALSVPLVRFGALRYAARHSASQSTAACEIARPGSYIIPNYEDFPFLRRPREMAQPPRTVVRLGSFAACPLVGCNRQAALGNVGIASLRPRLWSDKALVAALHSRMPVCLTTDIDVPHCIGNDESDDLNGARSALYLYIIDI